MRTAVKIRVRGLVHGVYFRASLAQLAKEANVTGWVRNTADGSVEALLEGEEESVQGIVEWSKHGPPAARVDSVEVKKTAPKHPNGFLILG
jgi:acylphosphatase